MNVLRIAFPALLGFTLMFAVLGTVRAVRGEGARPAECAQLEAVKRQYAGMALDESGRALWALGHQWYNANCRTIQTRSKRGKR